MNCVSILDCVHMQRRLSCNWFDSVFLIGYYANYANTMKQILLYQQAAKHFQLKSVLLALRFFIILLDFDLDNNSLLACFITLSNTIDNVLTVTESSSKPSAYYSYKLIYYPANIHLDEDVLKTSFVFVFRRRLQDVLIKTKIFA